MKLGIFGGSFDPVHIGHLIIAETCREEFQLDEIRFVPAATPPHKTDRELASGKHRVEMLELATAGVPEFVVDRRELDRTGLSYTVETLQEFEEEEPDRELFFLMGLDSLKDFPTWREPERIAELATLIAYARGEDADIPSNLPTAIRNRVQIISRPRLEISSSEIRDRFAAGKSIRFRVPRAVEVYVETHGLYGER